MPFDRAASLVAMGVLWTGVVLCVWRWLAPSREERARQEIAELLTMQRSGIPMELTSVLLKEEAPGPWNLAAAAEAAAARHNEEAAIALYRRLPRDAGRWEFIACRGLGQLALASGRLLEGERYLRRALELSPDDVKLRDRLGHVLQAEGRCWEAAPWFFGAIIRGYCQGDQCLAAAGSDRFFRRDEAFEAASRRYESADPMMQLADARRLLARTDTNEAEALLREVVAEVPDSGEAQGRLGRIIVDRGDLAEFLLWRGGLSDAARAHPETWYVQGMQARQSGLLAGAVRCFLEALEMEPNHVGSHVQAAACLKQLGRDEAAREFEERGKLLAELDSVLNVARSSVEPVNFFRIAELMSLLGRRWEAAGWASRLEFLDVDYATAKTTFGRYLEPAWGSWEKQDRSVHPLRLVNRQDFPLPHWELPVGRPDRMPAQPEPTGELIAWEFVEEARERGVDFTYYEGTGEANRLEHIFNVMGGGLAAIDYDVDGWPDLYIAQANQWRDPAPQPEHSDRLFRNRGGERFADQTSPAGLGDLRFSHGVCVGDFDQDGFPDVYLGNLEPNRFYRNQGDGTFEEASAAAGIAGDEWTTSSVFTDLNNDALPDLYVLNYTQREETAQRECGTPERRAACTPDLLTAEDHRCYLNLGDGRFRDISQQCGILGDAGKGLGVVAWDYADDGKIGLYVANDTTQDFFFVNRGVDADGVPQLVNEGIVRGIAYDLDGNAQASMGVAAGDVTGDGRIDILITDFFESGNAMYSQGADGFFEDVSRKYGVHQPSLTMLGFGCHFADLDGDGWLDLIVTNGHVDQTTSRGGPDRMPPQIYRNINGERFALVAPEQLGTFFQTGFLGRGLVILDWNRDGRSDVAISHLHAPVALVTNRTRSESTSLVVRLIGRNGCREPTGSTLRLVDVEPAQYRLQTAGDGFLVTNERRHQFAVPAGVERATIEVRWPGGSTDVFADLPVQGEVLLVEGAPDALTLPGPDAERKD